MNDLAKLKAVLAGGHPGTGAYSVDDAIAAVEINVENINQPVTLLTGEQLFDATVKTEFAGLTEAKQTMWVTFCNRAAINPYGSANVDFVKFIFGAASATVTALIALRTKKVSHATDEGFTRVRPGTITEARTT